MQVWFSNRRARWRKQMTSGQLVAFGSSADVSFTTPPSSQHPAPPLPPSAAVSPFATLPLPSPAQIAGQCQQSELPVASVSLNKL